MRVRGQHEGSRGLVGMVRVSRWKVHYVYESPHKNSTRMSVLNLFYIIIYCFHFYDFCFYLFQCETGNTGRTR